MSAEAEAGAAPAVLASMLFPSALAQAESKPSPASSGLADIDSLALESGFTYGEITSIAGVSGTGKSLVRNGSLQLCYFLISFHSCREIYHSINLHKAPGISIGAQIPHAPPCEKRAKTKYR